ncbi:MAG TPA: PA14 domain-containing protein, partial [Candidatus Saccharimonadales bacterium]|nr:PA14 domain-containing protein [Candidatus Saccharimonadales bacterium]
MLRRPSGLTLNIKIQINILLRRILALSFLTVFVASMLVPPASAYAASQAVKINPHVKGTPPDTTTPMQQNYPGATPIVTSNEQAAADAQPTNPTTVDQIGKRSVSSETLNELKQKPKVQAHELTNKRTATTTTSVNADGTLTTKQYFAPKFFQKGGVWTDIDTLLVEDKNAGDAGTVFGRAFGAAQSWVSSTTNFMVKDNDWQARFSPSDSSRGMVRIKQGNDQVGFVPVGASEVAPVITRTEDGRQIVHYYDLWPGVNVEYLVGTGSIKENIILKNKTATNQIAFDVVGATLEKQSLGEYLAPSLVLKGVFNNEFAIAPPNLILNEFGQVTQSGILTQSHTSNRVAVSVARDYLQGLPAKAFPAVIDPTTFNSRFGTRAGGNYMSFKNDGYICYSNVCNPYAGTLYDPGPTLRSWRSAFFAPYDQFRVGGTSLIQAKLHLVQRSNESFWTGDWGTHTFYAGHASCLNSYNCLDGGAFNDSGSVTSSGDIDVTDIYSSRLALGDYGAWLMIGGNDGTDHSFKNFDPGTEQTPASYVTFTYGGPPVAPSMKTPTSGQVYVDPQPSFSVNTVDNPNGSTPLKYEILVTSGSSATGVVVPSGLLDSTQWTIPDHMLQDGATYYVQARSYDPITATYSGWGASVPFRIDMRTGKDKTQTYDTLGPVSVDLASGNVTTGAASHTSAASGGSLGVNLDYNSPLRSRNGLVGEYWNVATNYSGGAPTATPDLTRVDQKVDFDWGMGSPGIANSDWFYARWQGYFVAPTTGTYYFGGNHDDYMAIYLNDTQLYTSGGCYTGVCYGSSITLQEGQVIKFRTEFREHTSPAYVHLYVKGPVTEQVIPAEWLQTGVRPVEDPYGLVGSYYGKFDGTNTFSSGNTLMMKRTDPYLNFDWGTAAPTPNGPDGFLVRWTGFVKVPATGNYTFGVKSDDGVKIMLGNSNTVVYNEWVDRGATESYGTAYSLTADTPTKITIEYYDNTGAASFVLKVQGAVPQQIVPRSWLTPGVQS